MSERRYDAVVGQVGQRAVHDFTHTGAVERERARPPGFAAIRADLDAKGAPGPEAHTVEGKIVPVAQEETDPKELFDAGDRIGTGGRQRPEIERGIEKLGVTRIDLGEERIERRRPVMEGTDARSRAGSGSCEMG